MFADCVKPRPIRDMHNLCRATSAKHLILYFALKTDCQSPLRLAINHQTFFPSTTSLNCLSLLMPKPPSLADLVTTSQKTRCIPLLLFSFPKRKALQSCSNLAIKVFITHMLDNEYIERVFKIDRRSVTRPTKDMVLIFHHDTLLLNLSYR